MTLRRFLLLGSVVGTFCHDGARGQTSTAITAPALVTAGQPYAVSVQLVGQPAPAVAGLQFSLSFPTTWGAPVVTIGSTLATAKTATCNGTAAAVSCVIAGINRTAMANGEVAKATFNPPANLAAGPYLLQVGSVVAVDGQGTAVAIVPGPSLTVNTPPVPIYGDLNNDGKFDQADLAIAVLQLLTNQTPCAFDQGQGCTLSALQKWIARAANLP